MSTAGAGVDDEAAATAAVPLALLTRCCGCVLVSTVLLVAEKLELLASLELFMLRKEPFSVGGVLLVLLCFVGLSSCLHDDDSSCFLL